MGKYEQDMVRVTPRDRCPICDSDSWCLVRVDGKFVICMRAENGPELRDKNGEFGGWKHSVDDNTQVVERPKATRSIPVPPEEWKQRAVECYGKPLADDARVKLSMELGVSVSALERLQVGCGWDKYRSLAYTTWPELTPDLEPCGIIRRYQTPVEGGKTKLAMAGGRPGLYLCDQWWECPGPICLVEGGSDTAALLSIDVCAIGRPSNTGGLTMLAYCLDQDRRCRGRAVVVIGERDAKPDKRGGISSCSVACDGCFYCWPGLSGAVRTAQELECKLRRPIFVAMPPGDYKDSRAWLIAQQPVDGLGKVFASMLMRGAKRVTQQRRM